MLVKVSFLTSAPRSAAFTSVAAVFRMVTFSMFFRVMPLAAISPAAIAARPVMVRESPVPAPPSKVSKSVRVSNVAGAAASKVAVNVSLDLPPVKAAP